MLNKLNERKAELLKQIEALQAEVVAIESQIKEEEAKQVIESAKVERKPSATIQALNGVKELLQVKYPDADIKKPSYYKEGDIHSTMHQYALTSLMASGSILTLGVTVMYIPYGGTDYEFTVTVEKGGRQLKHDRIPVNKSDITAQGIRNILANNFKLVL